MLTDAVSLPGLGSVCVSPDLVAVFRITPIAASRTVMCNVAVPSTANDPTVHIPVAGSYAPCDALELTKTTPLGSTSVTVTPVAASGPLSCAVMVYVSSSPITGFASLTVLVTAMSAYDPGATMVSVLLTSWLG
jgi:hypothetical protein